MARVPGVETILEPDDNVVVVFEEFFTAGLRMPPHLVVLDILLKF
jgi:tRNA A37 threonylcarbamoyladenosine synthetase subunit TsaC/SUA5/YrdC